MQVCSYDELSCRKPSGRKIPASSKHFTRIYIYVINSKHSIFMKHFTSSTSVVVEVPAQQYLFVHFVFLHKTKVNGLQPRDELNTSTNTTPFLQYSSGGERRGVTLRLCLSGSRFSSGVCVCVWETRRYASRCASASLTV